VAGGDVTRDSGADTRVAETEYQRIFEATSDAMCIVDLEGCVVEANPAACRLWGYPRDEFIGLHVTAATHPDYHDRIPQTFRTVLEGGDVQIESAGVRKDGGVFQTEARGTSITYRGQPHLLLVVRDITERVRAAAQLREKEAQLEQRVEERTRELTAILDVAHKVASTLELQPLLGLILDQLKTVVTYTGAVIFIVEEAHVRALDYRGPLPPEKILNFRIPLPEALGYQLVQELRVPVIIDGDWETSPLAEEHGDVFGYFRRMVPYARSWLVVPLLVKERVIGVVRIDHERDRAYTDHQAMLAMALATQAAVAIENARLYGRAQQMATLEERQRLARELHDSVTQALYGVTMYAEAAASVLEAGDETTASTYLHEVRDTALAALQEMRLLIFELRPPVLEHEGLEAALRARLAAVEGRITKLATTVDIESDLELPPAVEQALYGIAQETLNNIMKHSHATALRLSLRQEAGEVTLEIADNGTGFDVSAARSAVGLGLCGMTERADQIGGRLTVRSAPSQGTIMRVEVTG
jgi:PAS domain S-box-containing protein